MIFQKLCRVLIVTFLLHGCSLWAKPDVSWYGFIAPEYACDTRRMVEARDYHYVLYPKDIECTADGWDANAVPQVSFTPFNTRFGLKLKEEVSAFSADWISALVEVDFRGWGSNSAMLRLRKALLTLGKKNCTFFFGQNYHPFSAPTTYPNMVSYGKGDPYDSAVFVPQAGMTYYFSGIDQEHDQLTILLWSSMMGARVSGPDGSSSKYMRDGVFPGFHIRIQGLVRDLLLGASFDMRSLRPAAKTLKEPVGYYEDSPFETYAAALYSEARSDKAVIKIHGVYNYGYSDLYSFGGYAVKTYDLVTGRRSYTPLKTLLGWADIELLRFDKVKPGCFFGVGKNCGAGMPLYRPLIGIDTYGDPIIYGSGYTVDRLFRIAPRVWLERGPLELGVELEWDRAWYGALNDRAQIVTPHSVDSVRLLAALYYKF